MQTKPESSSVRCRVEGLTELRAVAKEEIADGVYEKDNLPYGYYNNTVKKQADRRLLSG
jgi:hypothetical protein